MENIIGNISKLKERLQKVWHLIRIDEKRIELINLQQQMAHPDFWTDQERAKNLSQQSSDLESEIQDWEQIKRDIHDLQELAELDSESADIAKEFTQLEKRLSKLELNLFFQGKYDSANAMLTIYAGAGGTDAQDWAEMIMRMYLRFCERQGWKTQVINISLGNEAGIKSVLIEILGKNSYGYLKGENGVHRLVRISPFDAEKMRHTSFAMVEVLPIISEVDTMEVKPEELRIDTYRSSGHGGQSVNTTDSAVRITHIPTNIVVTCQNERSQQQNRETAMKILKSKLQQYYETEREEERQKLRGEYTEAAWGNQVRSYVLHPYKMVKDHRTEFETSGVEKILDGDLLPFVEASLRYTVKNK